MRRLAIFTIIGILALAGCSGSGYLTDGSGGSSPSVSPTDESGERSFLAEPGKLSGEEQTSETGTGKTKDGTKTRESRAPKAGTGPTPVTIAGPGICGRTPEIQNALINDLNIASCRAINDAELYRIREISFDTGSIKPGDLTGFVNLKTLTISGLNEPTTPGIFAGLESLTNLHIDLKLKGEEEKTAAFTAKAFQGMPELKDLRIRNDNNKTPLLFKKNAFQGINHLTILIVSGYASIESGTFKRSGQIDDIAFESLESMPSGGLDGLSVKTLEIKKIKRIFPGSLNGVQDIRYLEISADPYSDVEPRIPRGLFSKLEDLRAVSMHNFKLPEEIELNNLEVVCEIGSGNTGLISRTAGHRDWHSQVIIVDGEKVEYLTAQKIGENKKICKIVIGDQIKEILITYDEE